MNDVEHHGGNTSEPSAKSGDDGEFSDSTLEKTAIHRFFVFGGPLGLAVAIFLSLWVSSLHVRHTLVVQVETRWRSGEQLAIRAHLIAEQPGPITHAQGRVWVEQDGSSFSVGRLEQAASSAVVQTNFVVPNLALGQAALHLEVEAEGVEPMHEVLPIEIVAERTPRKGVPIVAGSNLQHGDDTDPQPAGMRIVVRPFGRILAGFSNIMMVRVTHPDGRPYEGPIEVRLASGEFAQARGSFDAPPLLYGGTTDRLGLIFVEGLLETDVVRLEVRVPSRSDPSQILHRRRVRMVSFAGAVTTELSTLVFTSPQASSVESRQPLELDAHGLSARFPVFVDVHGPDGAFIETLPPFFGREPPREWTPPAVPVGIVQVEAYHFAKDPGESTAVARLQVVDGPPTARESLAPLIDLHREQMQWPRVEREFDRALEQAHLEWVAAAELDAEEIESLRRWLLGTLPMALHGPPTALVTHQRETQALLEKQRKWRMGLRIFLLGGGGLFLLAMTWTMVHTHGRAALATEQELETLTEGHAREEALAHVRQARRAALLRGLGVIAVMAGGLALTTLMLENLL